MPDQDVIEQALAILEVRLNQPEFFVSNPKNEHNYLKLQFGGVEYASFRVMFLSNLHGLIKLKELSRGTIGSTSVYPREVVKAALQFNAAAVILAHNHPSGSSEPSQADKRITERLKSALQLIDVRVLDHIVIGGSNSYSFAEHGLV